MLMNNTKGNFMIKLNGIYKLKKIKGFKNHDTTNYKVVALLKDDVVICENEVGEHYCFKKDFLIDPDYPEIIYSNVEILEQS